MMTVADAIAWLLAEKGIRYAFGIIGAGNAALFDAIARLGETEIVCCHHEAAAVMSATYYGRVRGSCGVAICTTGAGSSNAVTGALAANMDSAPLVVISGNEPFRYLWEDTGVRPPRRVSGVQGFATADAVKTFVKHAREGLTHRSVEEAFDIAMAPRSGAVWVDIPRDRFGAPAT